MAMDRTMYGKIEPSAIYQPYKITIKKGSPPGCESIIFFVFNLFLRFLERRFKRLNLLKDYHDFNLLLHKFKVKKNMYKLK